MILDNEGIKVSSSPLCALCGGRGTLLYQGLRDRLGSAPGAWSFLRCPKDGLAWLDRQPAPEEIGRFYVGYRCTHTVREPVPGRLAGLTKAIRKGILASAFGYTDLASGVERALGWLCSRIAPLRDSVGGSVLWLDASWRGRLLDVGCGNGQVASTLAGLGWNVVGLEPDPVPARLARERYGLEVIEGTLEEAQLAPESFDAITMHHVLEHLVDPLTALRECWRVLRPGGRLVVVTPNIASLAHRWFGDSWLYLDPPRHLIIFSRAALAEMAARAGFMVTGQRTPLRHAPSVWAGSRMIRHQGRLPDGNPDTPAAGLQGLAYLALAYFLSAFTSAGDELVLVAQKDQFTG